MERRGAQRGREPSWRWRRILIYGTVIVCFWLIYLLIGAADTRVNDTLAWSLSLIVTLLVMTYTGAATVQDVIAIWMTRSPRPYAEPEVPPAAQNDPSTLRGSPDDGLAPQREGAEARPLLASPPDISP